MILNSKAVALLFKITRTDKSVIYNNISVTSSVFGLMKFVVKNNRLRPKMYREGFSIRFEKLSHFKSTRTDDGTEIYSN
jgi:hypothetical protein